jgi:hypothetical protein
MNNHWRYYQNSITNLKKRTLLYQFDNTDHYSRGRALFAPLCGKIMAGSCIASPTPNEGVREKYHISKLIREKIGICSDDPDCWNLSSHYSVLQVPCHGWCNNNAGVHKLKFRELILHSCLVLLEFESLSPAPPCPLKGFKKARTFQTEAVLIVVHNWQIKTSSSPWHCGSHITSSQSTARCDPQCPRRGGSLDLPVINHDKNSSCSGEQNKEDLIFNLLISTT